MYSIYAITNLITGKQYVGLTKRRVANRFRVHLSEARRELYGMYLHRSMRKHGADAFECRTVAECQTHEEACELEREFIRSLGTLEPYGYNEHEGGAGGCCEASDALRDKLRRAKLGKPAPNRGLAMPQVQREQISQSMKGRQMTAEHRHNLSLAQKKRWAEGRGPPRSGRKKRSANA